ncbi:MAG: triphosphoribosyl-dephospho-CoA synthase [Planctomycetes bacterium]|nr:triphosphoribosyl-dephospho-CoA synthase [Planctomycetota bacterium]
MSASLHTPGELALLACLWESTARKAGNVHPGRDFTDLRYADFILSAAAIAPVLDKAMGQSVGQTILQSIQATRRVVFTNTNLGIVLLLAPMAAVSRDCELRSGLQTVLQELTIEDARAAYAAIRLAAPSGLGDVAAQDVHREPTLPFRQIMTLAQERDLIARQYANGFQQIIEGGVPNLRSGLDRFGNLEDAIVFAHLRFIAQHPDSLIVRKCGVMEAEEASRRAGAVLVSGWPESAAGQRLFESLDSWLREAGHRRNPGTSADLVAASLYAALRENIMKLPLQVSWSRR